MFRLDYGEAHVAIRAGAAPEEPDNVVQPLVRMRTGLYAARSYIAAQGMPADEAALVHHRFVGVDNPDSRAPFYRWMRDTLPADCINYRATEPAALDAAMRAGAGIGFMPAHVAEASPT